MEIQALQDRVLVEITEPVKTTSSGIVLVADASKEKTTTGKIAKVGPGRVLSNGTLVPMTVQPGEVAIYMKDSGSKVKIDGTEYVVLLESDILGILEE